MIDWKGFRSIVLSLNAFYRKKYRRNERCAWAFSERNPEISKYLTPFTTKTRWFQRCDRIAAKKYKSSEDNTIFSEITFCRQSFIRTHAIDGLPHKGTWNDLNEAQNGPDVTSDKNVIPKRVGFYEKSIEHSKEAYVCQSFGCPNFFAPCAAIRKKSAPHQHTCFLFPRFYGCSADMVWPKK